MQMIWPQNPPTSDTVTKRTMHCTTNILNKYKLYRDVLTWLKHFSFSSETSGK